MPMTRANKPEPMKSESFETNKVSPQVVKVNFYKHILVGGFSPVEKY